MRASSRSGTPAVPARASTTSTPMATSLARRQAPGPGLPDDGRRGDRGQVPHRREAGRRHPGVVVEGVRGATGQADGGVDQRQHPHPAAEQSHAQAPPPALHDEDHDDRQGTRPRRPGRGRELAHGLGQPAGSALRSLVSPSLVSEAMLTKRARTRVTSAQRTRRITSPGWRKYRSPGACVASRGSGGRIDAAARGRRARSLVHHQVVRRAPTIDGPGSTSDRFAAARRTDDRDMDLASLGHTVPSLATPATTRRHSTTPASRPP